MSTVNVLSAEKTLALLGETIIGANVVGNSLVLTMRNGNTITSSNVRGPSSANPSAIQTSFTPTNGIAATNIQAALSEISGEVTALNSTKLAKTTLPRVKYGTVIQPTNSDTSSYINKWHTDVFPPNYFTVEPIVVVQPRVGSPDLIWGWSILDTTLRSFHLRSSRSGTGAVAYDWIAVQNNSN